MAAQRRDPGQDEARSQSVAGERQAELVQPSIRHAQASDLQAVVDIYNHSVTTSVATFDLSPVSVDERREWFAAFDTERPLFVATLGEHVVGFAYYAKFREKPAYARTMEMSVYVDVDARGKGIGRLLLDTLIAHAKTQGVHVLMAVLGGDNPASLALHERAGFTPAGTWREVGRKFDTWVDVTVLQKIL